MTAIANHVEVSGPAGAPTVVLSNSLGSTLAMWDPQLPELEERFRVVRYDIRGHGRSPVPAGPYSIDDLADDLEAVLDRLGVGQAHLVGLSLGGMTAMRLAIRAPERIGRMVVLCSAAQLPPAAGWIDRARIVREQGTAAVAQAAVGRWFTSTFLEADPERRRYYERMVADTPAEGYAGCCEAIAGLDLRQDLARITAPLLVIAGADDPATPPAKLEEIAALVPGARMLTVPRSAHLANAERPDVINPALISHLEEA